jgi:hypothetical protein
VNPNGAVTRKYLFVPGRPAGPAAQQFATIPGANPMRAAASFAGPAGFRPGSFGRISSAGFFRPNFFRQNCKERAMRRGLSALLILGMVLALNACACRGGYVGPYGGVHPGRCWIW